MKKATMQYLKLKTRVSVDFKDEMEWAESLSACTKKSLFLAEYVHVVCNSGISNSAALSISEQVLKQIKAGKKVTAGHSGKAKGITNFVADLDKHWVEFKRCNMEPDAVLAWCESLPWIGKVTKYHLAKNLGVECIKPDRHLVRIGKMWGQNPFDLCAAISKETGDRLVVVDTVLWRAANQGWI